MSLASLLLPLFLSSQFPTYERPLDQMLKLTLATDRGTYYCREQMRVTLTIENTQAEPVTGLFGSELDDPKVEIHYRQPGADFAVWRFPVLGDTVGGTLAVLGEGETLTKAARVLFDFRHRRFVLNQPGTYELKGVYQDSPARPNTVLESNLIRIEVVAPPEREREAFQDYSDELGDSAQFTLRYAYVPEAVLTRAIAFLNRFPGSIYAIGIRHLVHRGLGRRVREGLATREDRELYERLRAENPPLP